MAIYIPGCVREKIAYVSFSQGRRKPLGSMDLLSEFSHGDIPMSSVCFSLQPTRLLFIEPSSAEAHLRIFGEFTSHPALPYAAAIGRSTPWRLSRHRPADWVR